MNYKRKYVPAHTKIAAFYDEDLNLIELRGDKRDPSNPTKDWVNLPIPSDPPNTPPGTLDQAGWLAAPRKKKKGKSNICYYVNGQLICI